MCSNVVQECASICKACVQECSQHQMKHYQHRAEACRKCVEVFE
ncbi:MAG: hypothetical protein CML18_08380 [Pusillimonas sp.]|nr:hypothetical protein [Pusillimonas sp.]